MVYFFILVMITFILCAMAPTCNNQCKNIIYGGAHPLDQKRRKYNAELTDSGNQSAGYDEYADPDLLIDHDDKYLDDVQNIVIDGNNLIYYMMGKHHNYERYLITALEYCSKHFKQNVFFVIKDLKIDFNLKDFATGNLHIVVAQGDARARDDFLALHIAESLQGKTIILTRDRYRDIHNITASEPASYKVYGNAHKKYSKLFDTKGHFTTIGRWTVSTKMMGFAYISDIKPGIWTRNQHNKATSDRVLILHKK